MTQDFQPYAPPQAHVTDAQPVRPRPWLGLLLGALVDLGGSAVFSTVLVIGYSVLLMADGMPPDEVTLHLGDQLRSPGFLIIYGAVCCAISGLAGYTCAYFAQVACYRWAAILGTGVSAVGLLTGMGQYPPVFNVALGVAGFSAVLCGAWLFVRREKAASA